MARQSDRVKALYFSLALWVVLISGCASSQRLTTTRSAKIAGHSRIAIRVPNDGGYEGETAAGSGRAVVAGLQTALIRRFPSVEISERRDADFFVKPTILNWEDRATQWSGTRDRISVSLQTYARSGALVDATLIEAKSSWWTLGGDHPQDLLAKPFTDYAGRLAQP